LYPVTHDFDGPLSSQLAVISAITGVKTSRALHIRRRLHGGRKDEMSETVFTALMSVLGHSAVDSGGAIPPFGFRSFLLVYRHLFGDGACVVRHRDLWVAVDKETFVTAETLIPAPVSSAPTKWRVESYQIFRPRKPDPKRSNSTDQRAIGADEWV
jgi:hypothetical protein